MAWTFCPSRRASLGLATTFWPTLRPDSTAMVLPKSRPTVIGWKCSVFCGDTTKTCVPPALVINAESGASSSPVGWGMRRCSWANMPGFRMPPVFGRRTSKVRVVPADSGCAPIGVARGIGLRAGVPRRLRVFGIVRTARGIGLRLPLLPARLRNNRKGSACRRLCQCARVGNIARHNRRDKQQPRARPLFVLGLAPFALPFAPVLVLFEPPFAPAPLVLPFAPVPVPPVPPLAPVPFVFGLARAPAPLVPGLAPAPALPAPDVPAPFAPPAPDVPAPFVVPEVKPAPAPAAPDAPALPAAAPGVPVVAPTLPAPSPDVPPAPPTPGEAALYPPLVCTGCPTKPVGMPAAWSTTVGIAPLSGSVGLARVGRGMTVGNAG